ncbi:MAG: transaldolase family protein [Acidobacteriota bacterium]
MKIFIDSADVDRIVEYRQLGLISGVTTNPQICARFVVSKSPVDLIRQIVDVMEGAYVFVQVISRDPAIQVEEAKFLSDLGPNIVIKVPMDRVGMKSIPQIVEAGLQVAATAVNSIGRAIVAAECGAHYMIPYYGWLEDTMELPTGLIRDAAAIYKAQGYETRIHVYCRRVIDIREAALAGAWGVLLQPQDLERFFDHAQTEVAVNAHAAAWRAQYGETCWLDYREAETFAGRVLQPVGRVGEHSKADEL